MSFDASASTSPRIDVDLVELRLARDERRRDLDHRVAAVVGAADQPRVEEARREVAAQERSHSSSENVWRVSRSLTSSIA